MEFANEILANGPAAKAELKRMMRSRQVCKYLLETFTMFTSRIDDIIIYARTCILSILHSTNVMDICCVYVMNIQTYHTLMQERCILIHG